MKKILKILQKNWFLLGMIVAVSLATAFPRIASSDGPLRTGDLANLGVAAIFFFHGATLSVSSLKSGFMAWRVHSVVQLLTFAAFPLICFGFCAIVGPSGLGWFSPGLVLGFYFLGALPSTISSSVAMVTIAHGNVPAAIFNATFSNLLGIILTPAIIGFVAQTTGENLPIAETILKLFELLLLPFILGQIARIFLKKFIVPAKKYINFFDLCVILLIVYSSFGDAAARGLWTDYGVVILLQTAVGAALILAAALAISSGISKLLRFNHADESVVIFCGSKKTLASGVPMAKVIFGVAALSGEINLGLLVLPIMFYHQIQILVCSFIANRRGNAAQFFAVPAENLENKKEEKSSAGTPKS